MTILLYTPRFHPLIGGLEKVARVWAVQWVAMGHRVVVVTQTLGDGTKEDFPFEVYRQPGWWLTLQLMRQATVIVQFNISLKGLPLALLAGRTLVISHHTLLTDGPYRYQLRQQLKRILSNAVGHNICCSAYVARQFKKASVVYSPYEPEIFYHQQLSRKPCSILFAGRLVSDKGANLLIQAVQLLPPELRQQVQLTVVGSGVQLPVLQQLVQQYALDKQVHFTGALQGHQLAGFMNTHQILVVPSRVEPFGTIVAEGLACGCRVISSNTGGLPEAGGSFTRLFEAGNAEALSTAIREELETPAQLNEAALAVFLQSLTVEHTAAKVLELLNGF